MKLGRAFFSCPEKRTGKAERGVDRVLVPIHFGAEGSSCKWMVRVASDLDRFSVHHLYEKAAGIRTIIGAYRPRNLSAQKNSWYNPKVKITDYT
jgi:hypothetical protein